MKVNLKKARLNVPLDVAMKLITEPTLVFDDRRYPEEMTKPGIMARYDVPMAWVTVPYLEGSEADVRATLARIAPEAVPLGLCGPEGQTAVKSDARQKASIPCPREGASNPSEAFRSDSPSSPLSAAGSGESCEEVKFPCMDASGSAADGNPQPEGAGGVMNGKPERMLSLSLSVSLLAPLGCTEAELVTGLCAKLRTLAADPERVAAELQGGLTLTAMSPAALLLQQADVLERPESVPASSSEASSMSPHAGGAGEVRFEGPCLKATPAAAHPQQRPLAKSLADVLLSRAREGKLTALELALLIDLWKLLETQPEGAGSDAGVAA